MKVPFSYLARQFQQAGASETPLLADLIFEDLKMFVKTGDFTLGKKLVEFEEKFSALIGVKHAIGVNSGTDALFLSLKALGIGGGDEVITSAETFIATAGAIVAAGAKPIFVDVGDDFIIDVERVEQAITKKTKAIMPVYFSGNCPEMPRIMEISKKHQLPVVEDSCCAIDADIDNKKAGSFGVTGGFSFHPLKNLNVWSDGGMITTNSDQVAQTLKLLRNHGLISRDEIEIFGYNSRFDTFQAVIGLRMIDHVKINTNKRIANAKKYDEAFSRLDGFIEVPKRAPNVRHVYHLYMVRVQHRDKLLTHCVSRGIEAKVHYPIPLPYQHCCRALGYRKGMFPKTEKDCESIITFPVHEYLTDEETNFVIETVSGFYK